MEDTYFKLGIELKDIYVVSFENIDLESETVPEGDIFQKYIGSAFSKRDIIVYTDGVLLDDSNYEVDFGQLTIYGVTGNTVVKIKPSLNTIMVSNAISDADVLVVLLQEMLIIQLILETVLRMMNIPYIIIEEM